MKANTLEVLIVEDNPGDAYMVKEMLQDLQLNLNISFAKDGQVALDLLSEGEQKLPELVILDLNMPRVDGFEVLSFMKASPTLKRIPVVVMTGSLRKEDERRSMSLGAAGYCIKPTNPEEIERSETCLRGYVEPLSHSKERNNSSGSSVKMGLNNFHPVGSDRRPPTRHRELFAMDAFENTPLTLMNLLR